MQFWRLSDLPLVLLLFFFLHARLVTGLLPVLENGLPSLEISHILKKVNIFAGGELIRLANALDLEQHLTLLFQQFHILRNFRIFTFQKILLLFEG